MGWLDHFRTSRANSASIAKDRLQVIIAHERAQRDAPDYLPRLKQDILAVIRRYVQVEDDQVKVNMERDGNYEVLELNITLPEPQPRTR